MHNLDSLGVGFFLVIISMVVIGMIGYFKAMHNPASLGYIAAQSAITK